ncbi:MAG TPA: aspartate kinase, partial [Spirochaetota bacterium]|nr:aspartate kinase [Spirochaetota bacterium]
MLTVEKIGGTSMSRFGEILNNIIKKPAQPYNRVFIVSAYGGVTNRLLEHKKTGVRGIYAEFAAQKDYSSSLQDLLTHLKDINAGFSSYGLDCAAADKFIEKRIAELDEYLKSMAHVLSSGYISQENILLAAREMLASIGEVHSAYNSAQMIQNSGLEACFVDLSGFDDDKMLTTDERIADAFKSIDCSRTIPVVTGYVKGTEGIMRQYDRGYSEITFSKTAVELKADEAIIHKEFHLASADPKIVGVEKAVTVGQTNFDVADQLADVGMEAIHPGASKPLEMAGINIRLKNAFEPEHPGTLIAKDYIGSQASIEIIAGSDKVKIIEIHDPGMVGAVGFDLDILQVLKEFNTSYILKATNANSISHLVWDT